MKSYLDFLKVLLTLGPKLPEIFAAVQKIIDDVRALLTLVVPAGEVDGGLATFAVDSEADNLEGQVAGLMTASGSQAIFSPGALRGVWTFLQAHPELLGLVWSLLSKAKG